MLISEKETIQLRNSISENNISYCSGLFLSARWFVLSQASPQTLNIVILPSREAAEYCSADLYDIESGDDVFFLPAYETAVERSNYKASLGVQRTAAISRILSYKSEKLYIVTYPEAFFEKIPKSETNDIISFQKGSEISHEKLLELLIENNFEKVDFVSIPGQFAIRGSIVDIFSYSMNVPYRLSFWGNEIDTIHTFNTNTQLSVEEVEKCEIVSDIFSTSSHAEVSLSEVLPENSVIWFDSYDQYKDSEIDGHTRRFKKVFIDIPLDAEVSSKTVFNISPQPSFNKNFELLTADIRSRLESGYKVYIYGEKEAQLERLKSILHQNGGLIPEFVKGKNIHNGFIDSSEKICCYSDHEIFDRFHRVKIRREVEKSEQLTINDLNSFNIGDYVVHIDHGIGIFGGLVKMKDDKGRTKEVVKITYKEGDVVFVSVHALNKISRFKSKDGEPPKISKMGSKSWQNLKSGAKSKVKDIAKDLINLYAKRRESRGFAFSPDSYLQEELESSFMYEDTPDQESANKAIKNDMEDSCPMDRLVCGDVGFGKTELAIRAAFKAAADGKQTAVLVPTTILALQHYETFKARLSNLPCNIEYVSRLRTAKELNQIKKNVSEGLTDIVIGTHKILGADFQFKDLGLLIVDEEQKFGVAAKEKLRQLKKNVDTLTLTATPIPRTLQFSLFGARDLSIINTPPPNRIPVQTEIILFNENEIKSIINYELNRGGQVFFLHNKVEELQSIATILQRLVPDMRICVAHGQMEPKTLENKILEFIRGDYDLLLCTTIIENGLDVPNANTILINQAQNFGLSDLHQLRGRVGRSNKKAFCYLIVPPLASITDEARRRLKAIEEFSELGSGFNIAMQDLDIRGAGNLLGAEQSGFITEMGYETYQKIISEAMEELGIETGMGPVKKDGEKAVSDCTIETDQPAYIPDTYIDINAEKIRIYKQLDSLTGEKEIDRISSQIKDRFGPVPQELSNLFDVVKIRNIGMQLGFEKIIVKNNLLIAFFVANPMSPYYKSKTFTDVLAKIDDNSSRISLKQVENKLKIVVRDITSLEVAYRTLKKLS